MRLVKLPSGVRPARCQLDVLFVADKTGVPGIAVALHRATEVNRQDLIQARRCTAGFPLVNSISSGTRGRPEVAGLGFAMARLKVADRRFIVIQSFG